MSIRIHYSQTLDARTLCGHHPSAVSDVVSEVSCRLCTRALARVASAATAERDRRGDHAPAVLEGPGQSEVSAAGMRAIAQSLAGEPVSMGPRWGSPQAALAALATTRDARRSVASSSSPDRFGRGMGGGDGGLTPTTPRETRADIIDLETAWARATSRPVRVGVDDVPPEAVHAIAEARLLGRRVVQPVHERTSQGKVVDRRSTIVVRFPMSALETGEHAGMSRTQIGIVARGVIGRFAAELARKGLVPPRAWAREQQEAEMASAHGYDLESWKDIAPVVGRSEDVCQRMARREEDPLPVRRYIGRVVAKRSEIEAWTLRQIHAA